MSKKAEKEQDLSLEDIPEVSVRYLDTSEEESEHQERLNEILSELEELRSEREEAADDFGEDHFLVENIDTEIQDIESERKDVEESTEDIVQLRKDILRGAAETPGFRLDEHWLDSKTIQALTHTLYGQEEETLVIADQELSSPEDAHELDRIQKIQIKREIVHLARDQLEGDERVKKRWTEFKNSRAHPAFQVIAREPGVGPSGIADAYDDKSSSTVRNWTSDLSNQEELKMVYTPKQGNYHLSTVGKYYAEHYADLEKVDETDESVESDDSDQATESTEQKGDDDSEQTDLGNLDENLEAQPKKERKSAEDSSLSKAETTEEKAEALFNDVSETRRTDE